MRVADSFRKTPKTCVSSISSDRAEFRKMPEGTESDGQAVAENLPQPIEIQEEMERSFLDYAMSVITSRALPDARDGLKPVHRRILFGMYEGGLRPERQHKKCAAAVGDVM